MATLETKSGITVEEFRKDYLSFGLPKALRKPEDWSQSFLLNKLRAAENELQGSLGCFYKPTRIVCEPGPALVRGKDYDVAEAAYDYSSDFYVGESWGAIRLRHYPVRSSPTPTVTFAYPNVDHRIFTVPSTWIRLNPQFGGIRLVPDSVSIVASFSAFILSIFSGGRGIPQSIFVTYTAGFDDADEPEDLQDQHQDFLELTKQLAVLNMIDDAYVPGSMTNSTDGISQTFSYQVKEFRTGYDKKFNNFMNRIKGVRFIAV
jgi:hypothetical protein